MRSARTPAELLRRLDAGEIVPLTAARWEAWAEAFDVVLEEPTALAGAILGVRWQRNGAAHWGLVEEPETGRRVVRPLADEAAVRALVAERLAAYERMWDG
ncbi:MAG: hypothetical protein GY838_07615 [bacterium]|nr:hypothetical protein [bacterium]